jgi:glutathione S-transferase
MQIGAFTTAPIERMLLLVRHAASLLLCVRLCVRPLLQGSSPLTKGIFMARHAPSRPIRFHRMALSGHCHRVELLLSLLDLPCERVEVNLGAGEQRRPEFLAMNPFGQVPVIEDGTLTLSDSNAILIYLAHQYGGSHYRPEGAAALAEEQRWFSVAAGPLASGPAMARVLRIFQRPGDLEGAQSRSHALFRVMDAHLGARSFLLGPELSLVDIAHYAYVAHAPEGGVPLDEYPHLRAWLGRIEATPRFVGMARSPVAA